MLSRLFYAMGDAMRPDDLEKIIHSTARIVAPAAFTPKPHPSFYAMRPKGESREDSDSAWWAQNEKHRAKAVRNTGIVLRVAMPAIRAAVESGK